MLVSCLSAWVITKTCNDLNSPKTTYKHLKPPETTYNHLQPPTTTYNHQQPPLEYYFYHLSGIFVTIFLQM